MAGSRHRPREEYTHREEDIEAFTYALKRYRFYIGKLKNYQSNVMVKKLLKGIFDQLLKGDVPWSAASEGLIKDLGCRSVPLKYIP
jgi:hypothetical protein